MDTSLWSDDRFRDFFSALRDDPCNPSLTDEDRAQFIAQARLRLSPEVQRRLLADVGAATDADGIARVALETLEDQAWNKRRTWLLVTTEPWAILSDLVFRDIRRSYRATVRRRGTEDDLAGIARASARLALPPPGT